MPLKNGIFSLNMIKFKGIKGDKGMREFKYSISGISENGVLF